MTSGVNFPLILPTAGLVSHSHTAQRSDPREVGPAAHPPSPLPKKNIPLDPQISAVDPPSLMGAQPSQCCDGWGDRSMETPEEVEAHPWTEEDPSKSTGQLPGLPGSKMPAFNRPKHGRSLLDLLQGKWHRKEDGQPVGGWECDVPKRCIVITCWHI